MNDKELLLLREMVIRLIKSCDDAALLDLLYKLLIESGGSD